MPGINTKGLPELNNIYQTLHGNSGGTWSECSSGMYLQIDGENTHYYVPWAEAGEIKDGEDVFDRITSRLDAAVGVDTNDGSSISYQQSTRDSKFGLTRESNKYNEFVLALQDDNIGYLNWNLGREVGSAVKLDFDDDLKLTMSMLSNHRVDNTVFGRNRKDIKAILEDIFDETMTSKVYDSSEPYEAQETNLDGKQGKAMLEDVLKFTALNMNNEQDRWTDPHDPTFNKKIPQAMKQFVQNYLEVAAYKLKENPGDENMSKNFQGALKSLYKVFGYDQVSKMLNDAEENGSSEGLATRLPKMLGSDDIANEGTDSVKLLEISNHMEKVRGFLQESRGKADKDYTKAYAQLIKDKLGLTKTSSQIEAKLDDYISKVTDEKLSSSDREELLEDLAELEGRELNKGTITRPSTPRTSSSPRGSSPSGSSPSSTVDPMLEMRRKAQSSAWFKKAQELARKYPAGSHEANFAHSVKDNALDIFRVLDGGYDKNLFGGKESFEIILGIMNDNDNNGLLSDINDGKEKLFLTIFSKY